MQDDILANRRRALEESFFHKRNLKLAERLSQEAVLEAKRKEFARASGISNTKLLDRLINLDMDGKTVAALSLVPLVYVAWADGKLENRERDAILMAAVDSGMSKESASYHWLKSWLDEQPTQQLVDSWVAYAQALMPTLSADDRDALRHGLLDRAKNVAEAAGGFLGLGQRISEQERSVLNELDAALGTTN